MPAIKTVLHACSAIALIGCAGIDAAGATPEAAVCASRADVLHAFKEQYSEEPVAVGLQADGAALEVLVSPKGTFTVIATAIVGPDLCTTILTVGKGWTRRPFGQRT